jgi:predicted dehydrogenase/threonine dehydrogenase-like Zn-dependent dehydrogenase
MKQVLQNLRNGQTTVEEIPAPGLGRNQLLIRTTRSLISAGTERMLVEFGKASLIAKARAQPDKVKQVIDKIKTDGLMPTLEAVFNRLDEPLPLGYCNAGVVLEVGAGVSEFKPGDRVASNGPHAGIVCIPKNLCAKIPESVSDEQAAFTVLSSIGLQGIRLAQPTLGEKFVVVGVGLIGLATIQLLRASGCDVLGVDMDANRLALAEKYGAKTANVSDGGDPVAAVSAWTEGRGADAVLITASAKTDEIIHQAAEMCRKRGRIVLVGVIGLNLRRADFYEKELTFQVSCSYGPGRYDNLYEQGGVDYPLGFVRWTEQRNFQAILDSIDSGRLLLDDLITHHFPIDQAPQAYDVIRNDHSALGVVLDYPKEVDRSQKLLIPPSKSTSGSSKPVVGVLGAGNFSKMTLMPAMDKSGTKVAYIADLKGEAAQHIATKFGVENAVTDYKIMLDDDNVDAVLIAVGHNLHARFVCETLAAGKHAFVEKPLAMNVDEIRQVLQAVEDHPDRQIMVGFNRRFSPHIVKIRELLSGRGEPLAMNMTVNAGHIPADVWVHDPVRGGGRIIGEACHFIDLLAFLAGSKVKSVAAHQMGSGVAIKEDKMSISLGFEDGSIGTVNYFANGSKSYPKETLEVFSDQRVLRMDNFRKTVGFGFNGFKKFKTSRQDKGHNAEFAAFIDQLSSGGAPLIPLDELVNAALASFAAMTAASELRTIVLDNEYADAILPAGDA